MDRHPVVEYLATKGSKMPASTTAPADSRPVTMTVEQTADLLGLSRSAAYRAVAAGQLPAIRLGRRLLIPTAKLDQLLGRDDETLRTSS